MKRILILVLLCHFSSAFAQYKPVVYDEQKNYFNEGQSLPAETRFMLSGALHPGVSLIEVRILAERNSKALYVNTWKRRKYDSLATGTFNIPINFSLRGGQEYTFELYFYETLAETAKLRQQVDTALNAYLDQSVTLNRNSVSLRRKPKQMVEEMNVILSRALQPFKSKTDYHFQGFSDLVEDKVAQLGGLNLRKARFNIFRKKEEISKEEIKGEYATRQLEALKQLIYLEAAAATEVSTSRLVEKSVIDDYPVEATRTVVSLNIGYGGVYGSGSADNLVYAAAPYAGISVPLGNKAFASPFISNLSVSAGVFLKNLDFGNQDVASGPIVDLPVYAGVGYRIFSFLRLNAGASLLKNTAQNGTGNQVYIRPFVGLSAEINIWLGLKKNNR